MPAQAIPVERACGSRKRGGIYAECGLSPFGDPLEAFLVDPPAPVDPPALGLSPIGVTVLDDPASGATHLLDWVGEQHYANPADLLEEVRRFGLSRRLSRTLPFARLDGRSRILLIHRRALVEDTSAYAADWRTPCPKRLPEHADPAAAPSLCASVWWEDVQGGEPFQQEDGGAQDPRLVRRTLPSLRYVARCTPPGNTPRYQPAIFASFPLSRLVVIEDPEGQTHAAALATASAAQVPVEIEER